MGELPRGDRMGGAHDGDSLFDEPEGAGGDVVDVGLPAARPLPTMPADSGLPQQDDPDHPELLRYPSGPMTTQSAASLLRRRRGFR